MPPDLVALWLLNEGSGEVALDYGPFRLDGTLIGTPSYVEDAVDQYMLSPVSGKMIHTVKWLATQDISSGIDNSDVHVRLIPNDADPGVLCYSYRYSY